MKCVMLLEFLDNFLTYTILFKYNSGCPSRGGGGRGQAKQTPPDILYSVQGVEKSPKKLDVLYVWAGVPNSDVT